MIFGIRFKNTTECRVVFLLNEKNFCHVHDKKSLLERMVNLRNIYIYIYIYISTSTDLFTLVVCWSVYSGWCPESCHDT